MISMKFLSLITQVQQFEQFVRTPCSLHDIDMYTEFIPFRFMSSQKVTNCIKQIKGGAVAQRGFPLHYILIRIIHLLMRPVWSMST